MNIEQAIYGRCSVRDFADGAVDDDHIHRLVNAAVAAPSAVNRQAWHFDVVRGRGVLSTMSRQIADHMRLTAPVAASPNLQQMMADPHFEVLHGAPALIIISGPADSPWVVADCTLAAQNLMLMAYSLGLGTCWIGSAEGWLASPHGRSAIGLDATLRPVAPIIVGHPRQAPVPVPRNTPDIHWVDVEPSA